LPAAIGSSYYFLGDFEKALPLLKEAFEYELVNIDCEFATPTEVWEKVSKERTENAKIEERNRIIADLSHSIKNLIATVIDPLQQLKQSETAQPQVIDNAIRGANLIREIVNAMNLSFKGSIDDFRYDARHNDSPDAMSVEQMVLESLEHSAGNMFDGKYFEKFMRKYFPSREIYAKARSAWSEATSQSTLEPILQTLADHFFDPEISLENAADFRIGNEKGSAVKLMILFQEMIFNAVKYAAFVPRENRFVRIGFEEKGEKLVFRVENAYDSSVRVKSSGLGHVIIRNFAGTLGTEPEIRNQDNIYAIEVQFPNFWKEDEA
jgi:signal transduction histidine kinase